MVIRAAVTGLLLLIAAPAVAQSDPDFRPVAITDENGARVGFGFSVRGIATDTKTGAHRNAQFVLACVGKETKAYWSFDRAIFAAGLVTQYRIDLGASKDTFKPLAVQVSDDRRAIGLYNNTGLPFLRHFAQAVGALEVKVGDATLLFSIIRPSEAVQTIATLCGWKL